MRLCEAFEREHGSQTPPSCAYPQTMLRIPFSRRQLVVLSVVGGYDTRMIAQIVRLPRALIEYRLYRALRELGAYERHRSEQPA